MHATGSFADVVSSLPTLYFRAREPVTERPSLHPCEHSIGTMILLLTPHMFNPESFR